MNADMSPARFTRVDGVRSRAVGDEFVVLDPATRQAHALSGIPAQVWSWLDGGTYPSAESAEIDDALDSLVGLGLLRPAGMSRRSLLRTGGGLAAGVGIASIVLPEASAAASTTRGATVITPGPGTFTIPAGARAVMITLIGGSGGYAQDHSGQPGAGGSVLYSSAAKLSGNLNLAYNVGAQGSGPLTPMTPTRQDIYTSAAGGGGGTGGFAGGAGGGNGDGTFPDLGGGGGGATTVTFSGAFGGTLIAGGGGGAGDGYYMDFATAGHNTGGNGGSVTSTGAGAAGTAGTVGSSPGTGGAGGAAGGGGAVGTSGTMSGTANINGGGGGGGGAKAGGAGTNGGNGATDTAAQQSAGGGGGAGSSSLGGVSGASFGTNSAISGGMITYSYITSP